MDGLDDSAHFEFVLTPLFESLVVHEFRKGLDRPIVLGVILHFCYSKSGSLAGKLSLFAGPGKELDNKGLDNKFLLDAALLNIFSCFIKKKNRQPTALAMHCVREMVGPQGSIILFYFAFVSGCLITKNIAENIKVCCL